MDLHENTKIQNAIAHHLATGKYASAEEVVLIALQRLHEDDAEYQDTLESLQRSFADVDSGRVIPAATLVKDLHEKYGTRASE